MRSLSFLIFIPLLLSSCYLENILSYKIPSIEDQFYFDKINIDCSENPSYFPQDTNSLPLLPKIYHKATSNNTLESFLVKKEPSPS